jgi:hypothetical protein
MQNQTAFFARFGGTAKMSTPAFDLFRMDTSGQPIWMGMIIGDINSAAKRLKQLARTFPGEYFVFSQAAQKIVVVERPDGSNESLIGEGKCTSDTFNPSPSSQ